MRITSVPLLILVILIVVAFWVTVPLLLVGLICGCHYRFTGPDLGQDTFNDAMGAVAQSLNDVVDGVKHKFDSHKRQDK